MPLSNDDRIILATKYWGMNIRQATDYLATRGIQLSAKAYQDKLKEIEVKAPERLNAVSREFTTSHLEHIEKLDMVETELWTLYRKKKQVVRMIDTEEGKVPQVVEMDQDPVELTKILREIREIQPYKSAYREATRKVLETSRISLPTEGVEVRETDLDIS